MRIGTAGWSLSREVTAEFEGDGSHLQRYARVLNCVEINSSFHRAHRFTVYERCAASTPISFRFSVKLPRSITHDGRLRSAREPLKRFLGEVSGLGKRLAVVLVQLPPSFAFEARPVRAFFRLFRNSYAGSVVCEPRHISWFEPVADRELVAMGVGRAAANPARWCEAALPGGWLGPAGDGRGAVLYHRWHGEPRVYWSRYQHPWLRERAAELASWPGDADRWCIFDNTASGAAVVNALELRGLTAPPGSFLEGGRS